MFYTLFKEAYIGIGIFYKENEDMEKIDNSYNPEIVYYLFGVIIHYANTNS